MKILWVLVNCNTEPEAASIGRGALRQRLIACFDIFPRRLTQYFWPPRKGTIQTGKGCLLVMETLPRNVKKLEAFARRSHSDQLPFIGTLEIRNVSPAYVGWMKSELSWERKGRGE